MKIGPSLWRVLFPDTNDHVSGASAAAKTAGGKTASASDAPTVAGGFASSLPNAIGERLFLPQAKPADILARYDLTDIAPREFSQLLDELHQSGLLTDEQFRELSEIRKDLASADVLPQEKIDLLDFYRRLLEKADRLASGDAQGATARQVADWRRRLDWLEKLAAAQGEIAAASPDSDGVLAVDAWT
ncbi:MAG: hypothetical protein ACUVTW_14045 [Thermogutta sp.]